MADASLDLSTPTPGERPAAAATKAPRVDTGLVLVPPNPVPDIGGTQASAMMPVNDARTEELAGRARAFVADLIDLDPSAPEFQKKISDVAQMGRDEIRAASEVSNRMLQRPVAALAAARGKGDEADAQRRVASTLVELRGTIEDLDPSRADGGVAQFLLNLIPFRDKLRSYFARYASAQSQLNKIIHSLQNGQDALLKDNAAVEGEKVRLWETMNRLQEYALLTSALDAQLVEQIDTVRTTDPARADALTSDLLFTIRQKHQDLLTQLAVSAQGYLALDVVRKNNVELIKGVERATTTTISALRTAVIVAQALANQKLVLDQITALNTTTSNLIVSTSQMLKTQSVAISEQSASATISLESLETAFQNIYETMDALDSYKLKAVATMAQTVDTLQARLTEATAYLERARPEAH
ncbi:toxic anion resistance protein [Cryobacterium breve]|uniref:Toxic anion resistance protein n=1 Tax=Cryobacterium breve TaxID=1259258 RepID=A0ABY7NHI6_9MICO|nr:toxic anion resistance protein [Cryobacterium breve]WBM80331.1 toxic anion resistance protein [Cryobacterium breve]